MKKLKAIFRKLFSKKVINNKIASKPEITHNADGSITYCIPVNSLSAKKAKQDLIKLIADYKENINWDDTTGIVDINGKRHIPYNKQ